MAPWLKKAAGKHPREPSPKHMEFAIAEHKAWFERLSKLKFGQSKVPDVSALTEI